jgi:hypothetical protein
MYVIADNFRNIHIHTNAHWSNLIEVKRVGNIYSKTDVKKIFI